MRSTATLIAAGAFAASVVALAGCSPQESGGSAEAARADSSAAGYAVGRRPDSAAPRDSTPVLAHGAAPNVKPEGSGANSAAGAAAALSPDTSRSEADTGVTSASSLLLGRGSGGGRTTVTRADSGRGAGKTAVVPNVKAMVHPVDSVHAVRTPVPPPAGPVRVNEFLTYDARSRTISLQLIAGYNGLNGSLNYNGATNGSHGISVPTGWRIHVTVANHDSDLQHSAIVVREVLPPPIEPTDPAFAGAALPALEEGLHEDETGTLDFIAERAGGYMIACGVPGHAQAGMWLKLTVNGAIQVPVYR